MRELFIDMTNGNDSTGDGSYASPYKSFTPWTPAANDRVYMGGTAWAEGLGFSVDLDTQPGIHILACDSYERPVFRGDKLIADIGTPTTHVTYGNVLQLDISAYMTTWEGVYGVDADESQVAHVLRDYKPERMSMGDIPESDFFVEEAAGATLSDQLAAIDGGELKYAYAAGVLYWHASIHRPSVVITQTPNTGNGYSKRMQFMRALNTRVEGLTFAMNPSAINFTQSSDRIRMVEWFDPQGLTIVDCVYAWSSDDCNAFVNGNPSDCQIERCQFVYPGSDGGVCVAFTQGEGNEFSGEFRVRGCAVCYSQPTYLDGTRFLILKGGRGPLGAFHPVADGQTPDDVSLEIREVVVSGDPRYAEGFNPNTAQLIDGGSSAKPSDVLNSKAFFHRVIDVTHGACSGVGDGSAYFERCVLRIMKGRTFFNNSAMPIKATGEQVLHFKDCIIINESRTPSMFAALDDSMIVLDSCAIITDAESYDNGGGHATSLFACRSAATTDKYQYRLNNCVFVNPRTSGTSPKMMNMDVTSSVPDYTEATPRIVGLSGSAGRASAWFAGGDMISDWTTTNSANSEAEWRAFHDVDGVGEYVADPGIIYTPSDGGVGPYTLSIPQKPAEGGIAALESKTARLGIKLGDRPLTISEATTLRWGPWGNGPSVDLGTPEALALLSPPAEESKIIHRNIGTSQTRVAKYTGRK